MKVFNTLSRSVEEFIPIHPPHAGVYSCGPTVYDYQHIGHMRRYVGDDILVRVLRLNGYDVQHVMNITDVGHLVSDSDEGEDKMEKGARKFGKNVRDIAKMFEKQFIDSCKELDIELPKELMHATDYIKEQIDLIQTLEKKGFTYSIEDGIYFDTSKFPDYFELSRQNPEELKAGARVEFVKGKKHISDFALWKFSRGETRQMEWESPWGKGFPGWHIECSAMSMKALGEHFDIHTGGIDHIPIHHTNEIAQSEAATGKKFVDYWVHHNFLMVEGEKMSKSLGNIYTVQDIIDKGYDPLALRYLYLQTHYRQEMNFTWEALNAAQTALARLRNEIRSWDNTITKSIEGESDFSGFLAMDREFNGELNQSQINFKERVLREFTNAINYDLALSQALSSLWEVMGSNPLPVEDKIELVKQMDEVLGLQLFKKETLYIPQEISALITQREKARAKGDYAKSDELREKIRSLGFDIEDTAKGQLVSKKTQ